MPIQTPAIVLKIRYAIKNYPDQIGLPPNPTRWASYIWQYTGGGTNPAPMKHLLFSEPLPNVPEARTSNRAISYITERVPTIKAELFTYPHDDNFKSAIDTAFAQHRQEREKQAIAAVAAAPRSPDGGAGSLQDFAHSPLIGSEFGPQFLALSYVGEYLIFRKIVTTKEWSVAHMVIHPPLRPDGPCWFETCSPRAYEVDTEKPVVCGVFYEPLTRPRQFFTMGRHIDRDGLGGQQPTVELRTAYFLGTPRPGVDGNVHDLCGVRLGPGRYHGEPRAYGIWCARLKTRLSAEERTRLIAQFSIRDNAKLAEYTDYVPGLDAILAWVGTQKSLSIQRPK